MLTTDLVFRFPPCSTHAVAVPGAHIKLSTDVPAGAILGAVTWVLLVVSVLVIVISHQERTMVSVPQVAVLSVDCRIETTVAILSIQLKFIGHTVYSVPSIVILKYQSVIPDQLPVLLSNPEDVQ